MNKEKKQQVVQEYREKFASVKMGVLTEYRGLTVAEMTDLRKKLREASLDFRVVKNSLVKIAAEGTPLEAARDYFQGPIALVLSYDDVVAPAKLLTEAAKTHKKLQIRTGVMDGAILSNEELARFATLPSREELYSMFLRVLQAPLTQVCTALTAPLRDLANALNAVKEKKAA